MMLILFATPALAQSVTCDVAATPLAFAGYVGSDDTAQDVTANITMTCNVATGTATVAYSIVPADDYSGGRNMLGASAMQLSYQIYTDPSETISWTSITPLIGNLVVVSGTPAVQNLTIYGKLFSHQNAVPAGDYLAMIPIQLTYTP